MRHQGTVRVGTPPQPQMLHLRCHCRCAARQHPLIQACSREPARGPAVAAAMALSPAQRLLQLRCCWRARQAPRGLPGVECVGQQQLGFPRCRRVQQHRQPQPQHSVCDLTLTACLAVLLASPPASAASSVPPWPEHFAAAARHRTRGSVRACRTHPAGFLAAVQASCRQPRRGCSVATITCASRPHTHTRTHSHKTTHTRHTSCMRCRASASPRSLLLNPPSRRRYRRYFCTRQGQQATSQLHCLQTTAAALQHHRQRHSPA